MIRFDQRNIDIQGTERVFKKVVHSGQNAIRFVDKDGVPMRVPNTAALSRLHSTYTVSPRGVPTRKTNHSYSGQLTQAKMQNMVNSLETSTQEMASYPSIHSYPNGISSAGSCRHYLSTANSQKRRSLSQPRLVKSMAKSASSQRSQRMLVSTPAADQFNQDPALEVTNDSPQGKRLEKEWSALSQCRALKRSSEIVSHRVDRMYFMSGNKLRLQAKYHVEDDELQRLQELQLARRTSPGSRDESHDRHDHKRLDNIEKKLTNIEHRLNVIEGQTQEITDKERKELSEVIIKRGNNISARSRSSSESGIQEDDVDESESDRAFIEQEMKSRLKFVNDDSAFFYPNKSIFNDKQHQSISRPVIQPQCSKGKESSGIQALDIMSHKKHAPGAETMLKLFTGNSPAHGRAYQLQDYRNANELTLGVPRTIRHAMMKPSRKFIGFTSTASTGGQGLAINALTPECRYCKGEEQTTKHKEHYTPITEEDLIEYFKPNFPTRKPIVKISYNIGPVECECRLNPRGRKGPELVITGHQVPLCDREMTYFPTLRNVTIVS